MAKYNNSKQIEFYKVSFKKLHCFILIKIELTFSFAIKNQIVNDFFCRKM